MSALGRVCVKERKEVASAARKMPKIAPRVPPMSSTASMVEYKTSSIEPCLAIPESRSSITSVVESVSDEYGLRSWSRMRGECNTCADSKDSFAAVAIAHNHIPFGEIGFSSNSFLTALSDDAVE